MNYEALNTMIKNLIESYKCPECKTWITTNDIDIVWAAGSTVNLDIVCTNCKKHSMVKSQIMHVNLEQLNSIKNKIAWNKKTPLIQDNQIVELDRELKNKKISVSDLFVD